MVDKKNSQEGLPDISIDNKNLMYAFCYNRGHFAFCNKSEGL